MVSQLVRCASDLQLHYKAEFRLEAGWRGFAYRHTSLGARPGLAPTDMDSTSPGLAAVRSPNIQIMLVELWRARGARRGSGRPETLLAPQFPDVHVVQDVRARGTKDASRC